MGEERLTMDGLDKPVILAEGSYLAKDVSELRSKQRVWSEHDLYEAQLKELFEVENPQLVGAPAYNDEEKRFIKKRTKNGVTDGDWIYFPWNGQLLHVVNQRDYKTLRTNRNRDLINTAEQSQLSAACVAVAGLSVGSGIAANLTYSGIGIAGTVKIADLDILSTTNLNRVRAKVYEVGSRKTTMAAHAIYDINPYQKLQAFNKGLTEKSLSLFFSNPLPSVVFDEIDDFVMKIRIRMHAKRYKVPLIMLTSLGDNLLIDVERYDQKPQPELFNGLLGKLPERILNKPITELDKVRYAMETVGIKNIPTRALGSLLEIRKSLVGRPQLFSTVTLDGGLGSYLVRQLLLYNQPTSGRYLLSLDQLFNIKVNDNNRKQIIEQLEKLVNGA